MIRKLATEKGDDRKKSVECIVVNKQVQVYVQIKNGKGFIKQTKIKCNPFGCFVNNIPFASHILGRLMTGSSVGVIHSDDSNYIRNIFKARPKWTSLCHAKSTLHIIKRDRFSFSFSFTTILSLYLVIDFQRTVKA